MEDPVSDIPGVVHALTQSSPKHQKDVIHKYFVPDAAFKHPFCRVESTEHSRWWVEKIYRWYKIMSPRIELEIESVAFDEKNRTAYASIHQVFKIWAVPFHRASCRLVTVLKLVKYTPPDEEMHSYAAVAATKADKPKPLYFIKSQNDLYQTDEFVKFIPVFNILWALVVVWQWLATFACAAGCYILYPITWLEQNSTSKGRSGQDATPRELANGMIDQARVTSYEVAQRLANRAERLTNGKHS